MNFNTLPKIDGPISACYIRAARCKVFEVSFSEERSEEEVKVLLCGPFSGASGVLAARYGILRAAQNAISKWFGKLTASEIELDVREPGRPNSSGFSSSGR